MLSRIVDWWQASAKLREQLETAKAETAFFKAVSDDHLARAPAPFLVESVAKELAKAIAVKIAPLAYNLTRR